MQASHKKILFLQFQPVAGYPPLMNLMRRCAGLRELHLIYLRYEEHALALPPDLRKLVLSTRTGGPGRIRRLLGKCSYACDALKAVLRGAYGIVVITDANASWLGCLIRPLFRGTLVYIEYDTAVGTGLRAKLQQAARNRLARIADFVMVPNFTRLNALVKATGRRGPAARLANFPTQRELATGSMAEFSPGNDRLRLYYQGTLVPERLPESLFAALRSRKNVTLTIRGLRTIPENGYFDVLTSMIRRYGIGEQVRLLEPLAADALRDDAATHHAGVAFFSSSSPDVNLQTMWGASNKIYQYMAYGLLVLYSSSEEEMIASMENVGVRCNMADVDSITSAFDYICNNWSQVQAMREKAREMIATEWNFEAEFKASFEPLLG